MNYEQSAIHGFIYIAAIENTFYVIESKLHKNSCIIKTITTLNHTYDIQIRYGKYQNAH
jgi:hypothetical protein